MYLPEQSPRLVRTWSQACLLVIERPARLPGKKSRSAFCETVLVTTKVLVKSALKPSTGDACSPNIFVKNATGSKRS